MKKIIFVEKEEGSYDPVATFFNKKAPSVPKSINSTAKTSYIKPNTEKKIAAELEKPQKPSIVKKEDEITAKIGKKGQYQAPNIPKPYPLKQQVLKSREQGRSNVKKQSKSNILKEQIPKILSQKELKEAVKEDSIQKMKEQQISKPIKKDKVEASKNQSLFKRVKELEERQLQYQRKIEQLQAKEQKYAKNEQKLLKMQKDFKAMTLKSRQGETAQQKLKEREVEIKQMLEGNTIPFNRKREVILNNKIRQLKRLNKELILRIKNYKGSDLVDLSVQQNREQITKDLYPVDVQKELAAEMNAEMQSLLVQLINKLKSYMDSRIKEKGERTSWNNQQKFLLQISNLSEKISLNYLNNYDITPMPKSNEEAVSVYSILEEYKKSNQMTKAIDRFSLNFNLSRQNMEIIQGLDQINTQSLKLKSQLGRAKNRREDVGKLKEYLNMFQKRSSFLQILMVQNICQMQYMKDWLQKATGRVSSELASTLKQLQEIKNIVELGPSAKQSLFLYLETNLQKLSTRFTDLRHEVKHIQVDFKWIQSCSSSR